MSKKEKRYVLKPKFTLNLIPKRDLVLGFLILVFGAFCFGYLFLGLFLSFYFETAIVRNPIPQSFVIPLKDLKLIAWFCSLIGVAFASSFSYIIWFSNFQRGKSYKTKSSFITHTAKDFTWIVIMFTVRIMTLAIILVWAYGIHKFFSEVLLLFLLSFIILVLRENNHLRQRFMLSWGYDFLKLFSYTVFSVIIASTTLPMVNSLHNQIQKNTIKGKYGITLPVIGDADNFGKNYYQSSKIFFFKEGDYLFLAKGNKKVLLSEANEFLDGLQDVSYHYRPERLYYIDHEMAMKDVDELIKTNFIHFPFSFHYAFERENNNSHFNHFYAGDYIYPFYSIVKNGNEFYIGDNEKVILKTEGPPPPPTMLPAINFDTRLIADMPFVHLHIADDKNYYWNDTLVPSSRLGEEIYEIIGSDSFLIISYGANVTFESLVKTSVYLTELIKNKRTLVESENGLNLDLLKMNDPDKYDEIRLQFRLRGYTLANFYTIEAE